MPISEIGAEKLVELSPWRRHAATAWARVKHLVGLHSYYETLYPTMKDGVVVSFYWALECVVCDRRP